MLPPLLFPLFFLSLFHCNIVADEPRWKQCDSTSTTYTTNSTFSANLGRALDHLKNYTALTNFNATTITAINETESVTALALCRGTLTPSDCQSCINMSVSGILQNCPNQTTAEIWYSFCMIRYSNVNFLTKPDDNIVFSIWDLRDVPQPEIYDHRVRVLMQNLSVSAGEFEKRYSIGWTTVSDALTLYGYLDCTRDINGEDCTNCLISAITGIESCCLGKWAGWICTPSCGIQFSLDQVFNDTGQAPEVFTDLVPPPPLTPPPSPPPIPTVTKSVNGGRAGNGVVVGISVGVAGAVILVVGCLWVVVIMEGKKRRKKKKVMRGGRRNEEEATEDFEEVMRDSEGMRSFLYDFDALVAATDNFSLSNRLGSGGFGTVYKGRMSSGEDIAAKKLAIGSSQGVEEFSNEIMLLLRMQHRNLVQLLGCCLQGEEKILVYEYLPNKSLDYFLFDRSKSALLDWPKRFNIMVGVARGLMYLHEDSQLRIIHRDVKASNILLDEQMNPKISDFGLAKLFPDEHSYLRTRRIAGTIGYMAPEYAIRGLMSAKSDVFSFGVLMLEIISGRKNFDLQLEEQCQQLLKLVSSTNLEVRKRRKADGIGRCDYGSCPQAEVLKCIRIGLLCCQQSIQERPFMSTILIMLSNDSVTAPLPGLPGYQESDNSSTLHENEIVSNNSITMTLTSTGR